VVESPLSRNVLRIAILNDGYDTISLLSEWFQMHGHVPLVQRVEHIRKSGPDPAGAVQSLKPDVLVFDVGLPYAVNWYYAEVLKLALPDLPTVLTTANRNALDSIVGASDAFELTGTPQNLQALLRLVYTVAGRDEDGRRAATGPGQ